MTQTLHVATIRGISHHDLVAKMVVALIRTKNPANDSNMFFDSNMEDQGELAALGLVTLAYLLVPQGNLASNAKIILSILENSRLTHPNTPLITAMGRFASEVPGLNDLFGYVCDFAHFMTERPQVGSTPNGIREYLSPNGICFFSSGSGRKMSFRAEDTAFKLEMRVEHGGGDVRARLVFKPAHDLALKDRNWDSIRIWSPLYAMFLVLAEAESSTVGLSSSDDVEHEVVTVITGGLQAFLKAQVNQQVFADKFSLER